MIKEFNQDGEKGIAIIFGMGTLAVSTEVEINNGQEIGTKEVRVSK